MNMPSTALALPMMGMLILTMLVWIFLFVQRLGYASANKIDAEEMKTPADVQALIPGDVSAGSNNLKNLFELPVIFYAICLYLTVLLKVDDAYINCAWAFLIFRCLHSLIHCTYNKVMHRFMAYLVSSVALWAMVVRAFIDAI